MSFAERSISATIVLGSDVITTNTGRAATPGVFANASGNTVTFSGLRAIVEINAGGGRAQGSAQCRFYGLSLDMMNQLSISSLQMMQQSVKNALSISAGDSISGEQVVFTGQIAETWVDASGQPEVALILSANAGALAAVLPTNALSYKGDVSVQTILADIAKSLGMRTEMNGVTRTLNNPYFPGTPKQQLESLADQAGIDYVIDTASTPNVIAIWEREAARTGEIAVISPQTGMVGSPQYNAEGVVVTTLFNPALLFGRTVQVESMIKNATGKWRINGVNHVITSKTPGGPWFTTLACSVLINAKPAG